MLSFVVEAKQDNPQSRSMAIGQLQQVDVAAAPTASDRHDKPFCSKAITIIIDKFKKALVDTDNRQNSIFLSDMSNWVIDKLSPINVALNFQCVS